MSVLNPARTAMVTIPRIYVRYASQFNYSEAADRAEIWDLPNLAAVTARLEAGETITGDCSSTWEATRKFAGCKVPPLGYTGSELATMPHIALADALEGDGIVFGEYPGKHVVWLTESHPTNPKVAVHWDPETDGHGEPGFTQTSLQAIWGSVFAGLPITVLSLTPFLPPMPPPALNDYALFSAKQVTVPHGKSSERESVQHYDEQRPDQAKNHVSLIEIQENLAFLYEALLKNTGDTLNRAFRLNGLKLRADGTEVVK